MPRERRSTKNKDANADSAGDSKAANQPQSPSNKKRRMSNTGVPTQTSPSLPDLVPPPPMSGYGDTIVASNPFDDTPIVNNTGQTMMVPSSVPNMNSVSSPSLNNKPVPLGSGKVYPPGQSMVLNPQNPNAPPIYPCGICHKEVHDNDQALLCESGCNFWFHRVCTGLTDIAFHLLTAEVYAEWVCDKCLSTKDIPMVKFKP